MLNAGATAPSAPVLGARRWSGPRRVLPWLPVGGTMAVGLLLAWLNMYSVSAEGLLVHDLVNRALPALAPSLGLGSPYRDYWEIIPPDYLLLLALWAKAAGPSVVSFRVLHLLLLLGVAILSLLVYRRVFGGLLACFLTAASLLIMFSGQLGNQLVLSEFAGLAASLGGLAALYYLRDRDRALLAGALLLVSAGQMKDPFTPAALATAPYLAVLALGGWRPFLRGTLFVALGVALAFPLPALYLLAVGSVGDYLLVLGQKSHSFRIFDLDRVLMRLWPYFQTTRNLLIQWPYSVLAPILGWLALTALAWVREGAVRLGPADGPATGYRVELSLAGDGRSVDRWALLFYAAGSMVGFAAQDRGTSHYLIQAVVPVLGVLGLLVSGMVQAAGTLVAGPGRVGPRLLLALELVGMLLLLPRLEYARAYDYGGLNSVRWIARVASAEDPALLETERAIQAGVPEGRCIQAVYGWGVGRYYLYSQRKPCTRFFLPNILDRDRYGALYAREVIQNPPGAIYYYAGPAADMDTLAFEREVLDYPRLIGRCYVEDAEHRGLFWPRDPGNLEACVGEAVRSP